MKTRIPLRIAAASLVASLTLVLSGACTTEAGAEKCEELGEKCHSVMTTLGQECHELGEDGVVSVCVARYDECAVECKL